MRAMFDIRTLEFGYARAMSFTFTRAQEYRALYMLITAGYGPLLLAKFWSGSLGLYIDRISLIEAQRPAQVPIQSFVLKNRWY